MNPPSVAESDINSPSLTGAMGRYWFAVSIFVGFAAVAGAMVAMTSGEVHRASSSVVLTDPANHLQFGQVTNVSVAEFDRLVELERRRASSLEVAQIAADALDGRWTADELLARTSIERPDTAVLDFEGSAVTADEATALTDALVVAYRQAKSDAVEAENARALRAIDDEVENLRRYAADLADATGIDAADQRATEQALGALRERRTAFLLDAAVIGDGILLAEAAQLEPGSSAIRTAAIGAVVAGLMALVAAAIVSWFAAAHRPLTTEQHEPAAILGAPLLGRVPHARRADADRDGLTTSAAFQLISSAIGARADRRFILFAGATSSSTMVARHVGATFARDGCCVVVVDLSLNQRAGTSKRDARAFKRASKLVAPPRPALGMLGLLRASSGEISASAVSQHVQRYQLGSGAGFDLLPTGDDTRDIENLVRSKSAGSLFTALRDSYEMIIVDSAPFLQSSIAASVAHHADGLVVVVPRRTTVPALEEVQRITDVMAAPVIGYVYTDADADTDVVEFHNSAGGTTGPTLTEPQLTSPS